jgi:hypothetical protein
MRNKTTARGRKPEPGPSETERARGVAAFDFGATSTKTQSILFTHTPHPPWTDLHRVCASPFFILSAFVAFVAFVVASRRGRHVPPPRRHHQPPPPPPPLLLPRSPRSARSSVTFRSAFVVRSFVRPPAIKRPPPFQGCRAVPARLSYPGIRSVTHYPRLSMTTL